jgi:hypothetical protein
MYVWSPTSIYMYIVGCARKRQLLVASPIPVRHAKSRRHSQWTLCSLHERFYGSRNRGGRPGRHSASVVSHVRSDQMSSRQSTTQAQFSGQDSRPNDSSQLPRILARRRWVRATHTKHVEHGRLSFENGAAANSANFDRGHRDTDLKISIETGPC